MNTLYEGRYKVIWNGYSICDEKWGMSHVKECFYRIYYVYGGEAYYSYQGNTFPLKKGCLYVFPVMKEYSLWQNNKKPLEVLWFHIGANVQLCQDVEEKAIAEDSAEGYLLSAMKKMSEHREDFQNLENTLHIFLAIVFKNKEFNALLENNRQKIVQYIDENIGKDLKVNHLAEHFAMERSYFTRKFKEWFYISPNQYIMQKKMHAAAIELSSGQSVRMSAHKVGYTDEKAFSRAFKSFMEISPSKYKNSHSLQP